MIQFIKKHWLFIVLGALATLLALLWFLKPKAGEETIDRSLPRLERTEILGVTINPNTRIDFNTEVIQDKMPVLNLKRQEPLNPSQINQIAEGLGFLGEPRREQDVTLGTIYVWIDNERSLSISPQTNNIEYDTDLISNPPTEVGTLPNPLLAKGKLFALLEKLGLSLGNVHHNQKERYLKVEDLRIKEVDQDEASVLQLILNPFFNQIPVATNSPEEYFITASFDKDGNIIGFKIKNFLNSLTPAREYPLKNLDEIKGAIYNEGKILQTDIDRHTKTIKDVYITLIEITQSNLAYFISEKNSALQPIYILRGDAQISEGQQIPISIYLPAIKNEYFKTTP